LNLIIKSTKYAFRGSRRIKLIMHGKVQHPHKMSQHMIPLDNIFHIFASLIRRQIKFAQEAIAHKNEDTTNSQEYVIQTEEDW